MSEVAPTPLFPAGSSISRQDFPSGFIFGTASSAFQYEGAPKEDGRGQSIWDVFLKANHHEIVAEDGLEAIRQYHRFEKDIEVMKEMGWDSYRFSISWTRILPKGRRSETTASRGVNQKGVDFYNALINKLLANGIKPLVTLFHWDSPLDLENEYHGFLSTKIVDDFSDYADLCFSLFGDRVKHWTTFNEPWSFAIGGYALGTLAPGRGASESMRMEMKDYFPGGRATPKRPRPILTPAKGNPSTEPYIVAHNQLLAHAAAVKLYNTKYKGRQCGIIGITLVANWEVPYSNTNEDKAAAQRALDFMFGWFMDPIATGEYPNSMVKALGVRLPRFTPQQSRDLKGSFDYLGLNYYTANYAQNDPTSRSDAKVKCTTEQNGVPIGEKAGSDWLYVYPLGIYELLKYIKMKYKNPKVYITENGRDELNEKDLSFWVSLFDFKRISYHSSHLNYIKKAIGEGADVKGYYVWSLMDNLEWSSGFGSRFGINFINFNDNVERYPKLSAAWFKLLLQKDDAGKS